MTFVYTTIDRRPLITVPRASWPFLLLVCLICIALDGANIIGMLAEPRSVAHFACTLRPLAIVWPPNLSIYSLQYIDSQCLGQANKETVSIIFLAIKLTISVASIPILVGFMACWPNNFLKMRDHLYQQFDSPGVYKQKLRDVGGKAFGMAAILFCLLLLATTSTTDIRFDLYGRMALETFLTVGIPVTTARLLAVGAVFISFALKGNKAMPGDPDDGRGA